MTVLPYPDIDDAFVIQTLEVATRNYLWQVKDGTNYEDKPSSEWFQTLELRTSDMIERLKKDQIHGYIG